MLAVVPAPHVLHTQAVYVNAHGCAVSAVYKLSEHASVHTVCCPRLTQQQAAPHLCFAHCFFLTICEASHFSVGYQWLTITALGLDQTSRPMANSSNELA